MTRDKYRQRTYKTFANSGRPGLDNFNLGAALDELASKATSVSNSVQADINAVNQIKTTIGAGVSGITNQVKSVFNGSPAPATPMNSPQTTYNSVAMQNAPSIFQGGSPNWLLIALGVVSFGAVVYMISKK